MSKNFKYLDDLINRGVKDIVLDSDIVLEDDEKSNYEEGIKLDVDDLVINGNGHTIDAKGKTRIFEVTGKNITIKNITLKNGFTKDAGGAISNAGKLTITSSTLQKNTAKRGGAIINYTKLTITDSNLQENTASDSTSSMGGAIYNFGNLTITSSAFINNLANIWGGAIYNHESKDDRGTLTITKSIFNKNKAKITNILMKKSQITNVGGAIVNLGILTITESSFNSNIANDGGAISNNNEVKIVKSSFSKNMAKTKAGYGHGGAILNQGGYRLSSHGIPWGKPNNGKMTIIESTLQENIAEENGGAIHNEDGFLTITKSILSNNKSTENGGAISNAPSDPRKIKTGVKSVMNCEDCDFLKNSSNRFGGAIFTTIHTQFYNCTFCDNISNKEGNIIYFDGNADINLSIEESFLNNNYSKNSGIYINNISQTTIRKTKINNISDNYMIYNKRGILNITDLKFENGDKETIYNNHHLQIDNNDVKKFIKSTKNSVIINKNEMSYLSNGFLYLEDLINKNSENVILDCDIIMNFAEHDYYEGGIELNKDNLTIDGQNHIIDATKLSRVFIITGNNITLKNIKFKHGYYFKNRFDELDEGGGAIYALPNTSVTIENCEFIENNSRTIAGGINNKGIMKISHTKFKNNFAQKLCGSISNFNILDLDSCIFENNFAPRVYSPQENYKETSGNIFNKGNITFNKCSFNKSKLFNIGMIDAYTLSTLTNVFDMLLFIDMFILLAYVLILNSMRYSIKSSNKTSILIEWINDPFLIILIIYLVWVVAWHISLKYWTNSIISNYLEKQGFDFNAKLFKRKSRLQVIYTSIKRWIS